MGVYIFRCLHAPFVKLGHHKISPARPNVYYRVAGRGFNSCIHPVELRGKLDMDDLELVAWYPSLTRRHEGMLHRSYSTRRIGEFHPEAELDALLCACDRLGPRVDVSSNARTKALEWAHGRSSRVKASHEDVSRRTPQEGASRNPRQSTKRTTRGSV